MAEGGRYLVHPCAGLVIRPGDTLIVSLPVDVSIAEAAEARDRLRELVGVAVVVVAGAQQFAAYRPDVMRPAPTDPVWLAVPAVAEGDGS